jgi:hypothetical protein
VPKMKKPMSQTEILHHFIYLALCKAKVDDNGILYCK